MSTDIPDGIKQKIEKKISDECILNPQDGMLRQRFAYFGYSLAQSEMEHQLRMKHAEFEDRYEGKIETLEQQLQESLLLYNNQTATIEKHDKEIKRLKELIKSGWFSHTGFFKTFNSLDRSKILNEWQQFKKENNL